MGTHTTGIAGGRMRVVTRLAAVLGIAATLLLGQAVLGDDSAGATKIDDELCSFVECAE